MNVDLKMSSEELCRRLIEEKSTLLVPGECFGVEKHMRIGLGNDTTVLRKGLSRLKDFLQANK
jgi:aspartate/methionine/tyrosine aminotransferase